MPREPTTSWGLSNRIERRYLQRLAWLNRLIARELSTSQSPQEILRRLRLIQASPEFTAFAESMAQQMAAQVYRESGAQWRKQAQEAGRRRGAAIYESLRREMESMMGSVVSDIVVSNSQLIKTIPDRLGKEAASIMAKEAALTGRRFEATLTGDILGRFDNLLKYQAERIARTEIAKAQSALTRARALDMGFDWYIWRTALDGDRVREGHRAMEGVLVNWRNPPNPETLAGKTNNHGAYHAGNIWNCRCFAEPVTNLDWVDWPAKVYLPTGIERLTRKQFERMVM